MCVKINILKFFLYFFFKKLYHSFKVFFSNKKLTIEKKKPHKFFLNVIKYIKSLYIIIYKLHKY